MAPSLHPIAKYLPIGDHLEVVARWLRLIRREASSAPAALRKWTRKSFPIAAQMLSWNDHPASVIELKWGRLG
jgi:hypothetical protein